MERRYPKEEHAIVLDFLPNGYAFDKTPSHRKTAVVQAIGKDHFVLLELAPKKGEHLRPYEEIYIGDGKRDKIHYIIGKLPADRLTATAKSELDYIVADLVKANHTRFLDFFNNAQPLTTRMHQIELLPGVGKKHMWEILDERKGKPFASFVDIKKRINLMPDPEKTVIKRIMQELTGKEKHMLFVDV